MLGFSLNTMPLTTELIQKSYLTGGTSPTQEKLVAVLYTVSKETLRSREANPQELQDAFQGENKGKALHLIREILSGHGKNDAFVRGTKRDFIIKEKIGREITCTQDFPSFTCCSFIGQAMPFEKAASMKNFPSSIKKALTSHVKETNNALMSAKDFLKEWPIVKTTSGAFHILFTGDTVFTKDLNVAYSFDRVLQGDDEIGSYPCPYSTFFGCMNHAFSQKGWDGSQQRRNTHLDFSGGWPQPK